ncbi:MAG: hypothetical protein GPJ51_15725 [Candidatus Heimdallarchaeota archaeon]|nr:hypothetical protein [Candidatus Heimdallarchaeota archaeon]
MSEVNVLTILHPELSTTDFFGVVNYLTNLECQITYTGFVSSVYLSGKRLYTDITVSEVDVNDYDIFYIAGGWAAQTISEGENSAEAFTLVQNAYNAGLLMTSVCGGAYIFAAADIVNGTQITGYEGLETIVEAAGGTYVDSTVVIDGQFITAQYGYHNNLVETIADVLGFYEETPPSFVNITIEKLEDKQCNVTVETIDASSVNKVTIMIYQILEDNQTTFIKSESLYKTSNEYIFSEIISFTSDGNYSLDVSIIDCYNNYAVEANIAEIEIVTEINTSKTYSTLVISLACIICFAGFTTIRRRNNR